MDLAIDCACVKVVNHLDTLNAHLIDISVDRRRDELLMQVKTTHEFPDRPILPSSSVNQLDRDRQVGGLVV